MIILDSSGWWQGKNSSGQIGFFPGSYVLTAGERTLVDNAKRSFADLSSSGSTVVTEFQGMKIQALSSYYLY